MKFKIKIVALIVLIIGIFLLSFGIFKLLNNDENNTINNNSNNSLKDKFPLKLTNFTIDKTIKDQVIMTLIIKNESSKDIDKEKLYLKFYNDEEYELHTYQYEIVELPKNYEIEIEATINFVYETIKKYEFIYNDKIIELEPIIKETSTNQE